MVVLSVVNEVISPFPLVASPMPAFEFVQLNVVPVTLKLDDNVMVLVLDPTHSVWLPIGLTVGVGFTVMVNVCGVPVHVDPALVNDGVTVIVEDIGEFVVLVATNDGIEPEPELNKLIFVLELVQL